MTSCLINIDGVTNRKSNIGKFLQHQTESQIYDEPQQARDYVMLSKAEQSVDELPFDTPYVNIAQHPDVPQDSDTYKEFDNPLYS